MDEELRVVVAYFLDQALDGGLIDGDEPLRSPAEEVNISGVNIKPQPVQVELVLVQAFLEESIRGYVGYLLQSIDLRQFILDGELIVRINVGHESSSRRFRGENQRLLGALFPPFQEPLEAGGGMGTQPGP